MQTSVAGLVYVEVQDGATGAPLPGHALADARGVRGNFFAKTVGWAGGQAAGPASWAAEPPCSANFE